MKKKNLGGVLINVVKEINKDFKGTKQSYRVSGCMLPSHEDKLIHTKR